MTERNKQIDSRLYVQGYEIIAGTKRPCRVAPEKQDQTMVLHLTTVGGSPFTSVVLEMEESVRLATLLANKSPKVVSAERGRRIFLCVAIALSTAVGFGLGRAANSPVINARSAKSVVGEAGPTVTPAYRAKPALRSSPEPSPQPGSPSEPGPLNQAILAYLQQPDFSGGEFETKLLGSDWHFHGLGYNQHQMVFASPQEFDSSDLPSCFGDPRNVEFAVQEGGEWRFRDGSSYQWPQYQTVLQIHASHLAFAPDTAVRFQYDNVAYEPRLAELAKFYQQTVLWYRGLPKFQKPNGHFVFNHGAYVAEPKEPSLVRLCEQISRTAGAHTPQQKVQAALDFVTHSVTYSNSEALDNQETLKAADEVLMTGTSDCSGMTILFASLLEQLEVDYYLAYTPSHITVFVRASGLEVLNGSSLDINGAVYTQAECTAKGFKIGKSLLETPIRAGDIDFLQKPSDKFVRNGAGDVMEETRFP